MQSIIIWKDGTYKIVDKDSAWEFENDENWLVTITLSAREPSPKEKELREALEKIIKECKLGVVHTSGQYIKSIATEALKQ